jgi:eukaryotic-like serine/threonine-protein kinase
MLETQTEPCPACGSILDVGGAQIFAERTCPVCGTPINVRRKFGHYELMSVVGSGGQGVVYRAVDNNLNRLVALKLLRTEYSEDPDFVRQFEHEAKLTASINHPNVVRVYSFGADEGHVYLAMELVDNGTMDDLMEKLGRIPEARALQIGIEVAQGLRAGHEKGLIHRDVKPGNVLFAHDGTAKVVDYGLAMFFEQAALASGEIWGTPYYLSPERLNKSPEDFRSDIYSLGAALFHAIAGRPPFEAEDASHVALKHLRSQAMSLQTFAPDICNTTSYVVNRTLAKNPAERQQSYDEFIEQLQFAREEALAKARGGNGQQQKARLVLEDAGSKKAMSWITLATLIVFVVGLLVGGLLIAKGLRGNKDEKVAPAAAAGKDPSSFGPGWAEARDQLLKGQYVNAAEAFRQLTEKHPAGSIELAWAHVHQGLATLLEGRQSETVAALDQLANGGTQVSKFFYDEVASRMKGTDVIPAETSRSFDTRTYQALAPLFFALKDYQHGHFDDAGALFRQFSAVKPEGADAWISDYKKLSRTLQDQLDSYTLAANAWASARNARERESAFTAVQDLQKRVPITSNLQPKIRELLSSMEKKITEEQQNRLKANFALKAKAQASGIDEKKGDLPEEAVDGDIKTRWAHKSKGEKWLALDLGAPKEIGRWVVKTAGAGGEKADLNFTELKLQKSDDGKTWQDVDVIKANRRDITDRLVPPFKAQHIRIFSDKGGLKTGDTGLRVFELEATPASEQGRTEYAPKELVATRFSPSSDFVFGPVGEPNVLGSAKFDPQPGKYTIKGAGLDIWNTADHFHFAWQPMEGNCEVVARVTSLQKVKEWTKAGVMIRAELNKESPTGMMACAPDGKAQFLTRKAIGEKATAPLKTGLPLPRWIKIERKGNTLIGSESGDGQQWNEVGRVDIPNLPPVTFVGMAVCSLEASRLAEAQFDNVKVTKK